MTSVIRLSSGLGNAFTNSLATMRSMMRLAVFRFVSERSARKPMFADSCSRNTVMIRYIDRFTPCFSSTVLISS